MATRKLGHSSETETDSDDFHVISSGPATKSSSRMPSGERIEWTDDDEPAAAKTTTTTMTTIKTNSKPKPKSSREPPKKRTKTTGKSMVGRKPKSTKRKVTSSDEDDDDDETVDDTLPQYILDRAAEWKAHLESTGDDGLCYPPQLHHEQDYLHAHLETRPVLPDHIPKSGPLEPIEIGDKAGTIPGPIAQYLKPYQVDGADFLYKKFLKQEGGILGDDMGLGKTIQVIAFLTAAFGKSANEMDRKRMRAIRRQSDDWYPRVLIVCPAGLILNWKSELDRWGYWHTDIYHGSKRAKEEALATATSGRLEIMITTYSTYTNDESAINNIRWDCVIADECHVLKGRKSDNCKAMMNVNALCRIGLSGTVIQNKYEELWVLLNWCRPGKLGPLINWKNKICIPLKVGQSHDATNTQLGTARRIAARLVNNLLPQFFVRRTKALIAHQLPKKSDKVVFCPLSPAQANAYNNFTTHEVVQTIRDATLPCTCGSGRKSGWCCNAVVEGFGDWRKQVFPVLVTLQKLSNHLALLLPTGESDPERMAKDIEKLEMAVPDDWEDYVKKRDETFHWAKPEFCGKWKVLKKLLQLWHDNGDKVLIFSHSVKLLNLLHMFFKVTTSYIVSYLTGGMSLEERQAEVDSYNADDQKFVFLISTKAGGVGLNITSANKVVIMDPNWNPAWDQQAQDRAYRMGQTRDVDVFRLVSVGTVEEIVYARQIYKQQQANIGYDASVERRYFKGVQDQKDQKGEIFGLANLFAPMAENVVLQDIVNKTNVAESRAGVEIAGLDLEPSQEDGGTYSSLEDIDPAMDDLAKEIIGQGEARRKAAKETAKKKDPVQAILASAGVEYTHENAEVIGTSKIETKISSRAQKTGDDIDHINELAFGAVDSQPQLNMDAATDDGIDLGDGLGRVRYKYRPPEEVRRRQFCTMAKQFGYEDVAEFALVVEGWNQEQKRDCLERFYMDRRRKLAESQMS